MCPTRIPTRGSFLCYMRCSFQRKQLYEHLQKASELPERGVTQHHVEIIRDLFTGIWFRLTTHPTLVLTRRGPVLGTPCQTYFSLLHCQHT